MLTHELLLIQADVAGFTELYRDTTKPSVQKILFDTCRNKFDHFRLVTGTTPIKTRTDYEPGGTMLLSTGDITGRITSHGSDSLGRWTYTKFQTRSQSHVCIISAYQPCRTQLSPSNIVYNQQYSLLSLPLLTNLQNNLPRVVDPRKTFIADLTMFIQDFQKEKCW